MADVYAPNEGAPEAPSTYIDLCDVALEADA
jgi:hypothetical protein